MTLKKGDCCPSSWDCTVWNQQRLTRKDQCFWASDQYPNGKFYAVGESVPEADGSCRYLNRKRKYEHCYNYRLLQSVCIPIYYIVHDGVSATFQKMPLCKMILESISMMLMDYEF